MDARRPSPSQSAIERPCSFMVVRVTMRPCQVSASHPGKKKSFAPGWPPATSAKPTSKNASLPRVVPAGKKSTKPRPASCSAMPPRDSKSRCRKPVPRHSTGSTPDAASASLSKAGLSAKKAPKPSNAKKPENKKPDAKDAAGPLPKIDRLGLLPRILGALRGYFLISQTSATWQPRPAPPLPGSC